MLRGLFIFGAGVRPGPGPDLVTVLAKEKQEITQWWEMEIKEG